MASNEQILKDYKIKAVLSVGNFKGILFGF